MHKNTLPTGDRGTAECVEPPRDRRPAIIVKLPNGAYFLAFRPRGENIVEMRDLRRRGIRPRIAQQRTEHGSGLGIYRWLS